MKKDLKKIVMIGPVYPYKGGIAHYTGLMCKALRKKYDVTMVSFQMQYPKFLYKKEQKDYDNPQFEVPETKYWIHTANPFNIVKASKWILKEKPDLVIFPWWHPYFAPCFWIMEKMLKKHTKIMFLCHNVFPHERFPMDRFLTKRVLEKGDYFIVQSKMDESDLYQIKSDPVVRLTPHPTYNAFRLQNLSRSESRELIRASEDEKILLFFGFVREYKGLKHLLRAMPKITEQVENLRLFVVGDFGEDREQYMELLREKKIEDAVEVVEGYIPDKEVEKYFAACDLVVLPYESATQSGIVQIAYGFQKPVLVTNVGGLPDVVTDGKTGYVVESKNPEQIADAVIRYFKEEKEEEFAQNVKAEEYKYSWDRMTEVVEELWAR